ncbi:MAG: hypothetical protein JO053_16395 [Acidobacteria bacterium]|nr:hypothetical protein [Acidobacteriota bacterium]
MQKIVLGIIAVFFLQATFQAYLAIEQSREDYQAMTHSTPLNDALGDLSVEAASVHEALPLSDVSVGPMGLHHLSKPSHDTSYASYRRPTFARIMPNALAKGFAPVTIPIPAPVRYMDASLPRQSSVVESKAVRKDTRSLPAKAFAVIKKPYDWVRSLAMKFKG